MYIEGRYWGTYMGGGDDSLTLLAYLARKETAEAALSEILADFGVSGFSGSFRETEEPLTYTDAEGWEMEIHFAIDLLADLAALLLECRVSGGLDLAELCEEEPAVPGGVLTITAAAEELERLGRVLADFEADPMAYDLSELAPEEDLKEMAALCGALRRELLEAAGQGAESEDR